MKMWRTRLSPLVKLGFFAMGTQVSITVCAAGPRARREQAVEAIAETERLMQEFGRHWWAWGDGRLAAINAQLAAGRVAEIPSSMRALFGRAWAVRQATGGLFDPRVASLVKMWFSMNALSRRDSSRVRAVGTKAIGKLKGQRLRCGSDGQSEMAEGPGEDGSGPARAIGSWRARGRAGAPDPGAADWNHEW